MDGYSAIAPKELQKQRKASGNGEYNLIKYVRCHHHTRYMKPQCVLLRYWYLNQAIQIIQYFEFANCARKAHWEAYRIRRVSA